MVLYRSRGNKKRQRVQKRREMRRSAFDDEKIKTVFIEVFNDLIDCVVGVIGIVAETIDGCSTRQRLKGSNRELWYLDVSFKEDAHKTQF